jgi:hypothetical protein
MEWSPSKFYEWKLLIPAFFVPFFFLASGLGDIDAFDIY